MIIVYVIDSYGEFSNGTTMTAVRSKQMLEEMGHTVRVVSISSIQGEEYFQLKERNIPIVSKWSATQKTYYAKPDVNVFRRAFEGADVVHFFFPWKSAVVAAKVAKEMGIAVTGSYHYCPEHVAYGSGAGKILMPVAWILYKFYKRRVYKYVDRVHCPSPVMADKLRQHRYKNILHPITNGVGHQFFVEANRPYNPEEFQILTVGRLSLEKRQEILFKAMKYSKYKDKIKLVVAGQGPRNKKLRKLAKKLNLNVTFGFYSQNELIEIIKKSDLYVHTAEIETEGISVLEALAGGLVPVLSNAPFSAPGQIFALDDRSLFELNNPKDLAEKIDYWIEHPEERIKMSKKYQDSMQNFKIDTAVKRLEEMFKAAVQDVKLNEFSKEESNRRYLKKLRPNKVGHFFVRIFFLLIYPLFKLYSYLFGGLRIIGKNNLKKVKTGAVIISNHVHNLDSLMNACATYPRLSVYTSMPGNFEHKVYRPLITFFGTIPTPVGIAETKVFINEVTKKVQRGRFVLIYPEGNLMYKNEDIQRFRKGAFHVAQNAMAPIIPARISFLQIPKKNGKFKKRVILNIGEPIFPSYYMLRRDSIDNFMETSLAKMEALKVEEYK